jgi:4-amino-4-deoxy-L-arabinose transferase-like glycosyltransferase
MTSEPKTILSVRNNHPVHGESSMSEIWQNEKALALILLVVCLTLFFFRLGSIPLFDRDEGLHAVTSKEMVVSGDWVTTKFNGENFYDKPVLFNWLVALSFEALGFTELAARLPAAILGLGCVIVTYLLGRKMYDPVTGFVSGMILATSPEFIILSRAVVHDISLVFFVTLALFFFYRGCTSERHRKLYFPLFYAALACAVLAKGPVGIILPGMIIAIFLTLTGKLRFIKELQIPLGTVIVFAVAAPWYILISLRNSDYLDYFVKLNFSYFFSSKVAHSRPVYYYIPILLGGFSPWSFFLPLAFIHAFWRPFRRVDERALFLFLWFAVIFLFFSAASSKLGTYILPSFPAASLLVGILWREFLETPTVGLRKGFLYSFLPLVVTFSLALIYLFVAPPTLLVTRYGLDLSLINFLGIFLVGMIVLALILLLYRHYEVFFFANAGCVIFAMLLFIALILPSMIPFRSTKGLAGKMDALVAPGEPFLFFDSRRDTALFYTNRKGIFLNDPDQLIQHLMSSEGRFAIVDENNLRKFPIINKAARIVDRQGNAVLMTARRVVEPTTESRAGGS